MIGRMSEDESLVDRWTCRYPPAEISPAEFEAFVVDLLKAGSPEVESLNVTLHERIAGVDGEFDFDGTVRYRFLGMDFLVVVEAKMHKNPIRRELVQTLHSKQQSVGAHKAVLISSAPFQRGAINFAKVHGIALVLVSEGRFTFETKAASPTPTLTREQAAEHY